MVWKMPLAARVELALTRQGGRLLTAACQHGHHLHLSPGNTVVRVLADLPYGDDARQGIDLYLPRVRGPEPTPWVAFVHGGGWVNFDRKLGAGLARVLASQGFAVASIGYRLLPDVTRREQRHDVHRALSHCVESLCAAHHLDPAHWVLGGESAGAHLALRALQDGPLTHPPRGYIGVFGYYDVSDKPTGTQPRFRALLRALRQGDDHLQCAADHTALRPLTTPVPVLLVHGEADHIAPLSQSQRLCDYLTAQGVLVELATYPGQDHGFLYRTHGPAAVHAHRAMLRILRFLLRRGLRPRRAPTTDPRHAHTSGLR